MPADIAAVSQRPMARQLRLPRWWPGVVLLGPTLLLLVGLYLIPLVIVLSRSFTDPTLGLQNYIDLWKIAGFRNVLANTLEIAAWTTIICLVVGYPFAYRAATLPASWSRALLFLCLVPFFTAILARLYAWTIILGYRGVINTFLMSVGIIHEPLDLLFNREAVVIGMVHVMLPYMILVLYSTMATIDRTLLDAAKSLGASPFGAFRRVFLPLSMPGVYAGVLLVFIISLGFFITPAVLGSGHELTIATYVQEAISQLAWNEATAMCVLLLLVTIVLFYFFNRLFGTDRLLTGGTRK